MTSESNIALKKNINKRESGLELFRIITMLLIVAHHYVVNSGLWGTEGPVMTDPTSWKSLFLLCFGAWGKTGINCFVLITGYFMCESKITLKKFLKLLLEVEFYKVLFYAIFIFTGYVKFSVGSLVKDILPVYQLKSNFTGSYLLFFLCIPFLNILIRNMEEKQHIRIIGLLGFIYVGMGTVFDGLITMNYLSWFAVIYLIGAYIRRYPKSIFNNKKIWGLTTVFLMAISTATVVIFAWLGLSRFSPYYLLHDSNKIFAVLTAVSAFLCFKNMKFKSSFVNSVAASCFGVLLIHANSGTMRKWLWTDVLNNVGAYNSRWLILHAVSSVLAIYIVCTIIDYLRIRLLERPFFKLIDSKLDNLVSKYKKTEEKLCKKLQIKED